MQDFDTQVRQLCSSCIFQNQEQCYCQCLDASVQCVSIEFISAQFEQLSIDSNQTSNHTYSNLLAEEDQQISEEPQQASEDLSAYYKENGSTNASQKPEFAISPPNANRSVTKDNVSHKKISKFLEKCYRKVTGVKLCKEIKKSYYREDYACRIWTQLEREGKLTATYPLFQTSMAEYKQEIQGQLVQDAEKAGHLNHLLELIDRYMTAFEHYMNDELELSLKTIYDYENMRQKKNFTKAWKELQELRQSLGLPFEIPTQ